MLPLLPFWRQQLFCLAPHRVQTASPRDYKTHTACFIAPCFIFQSYIVLCLSNAKFALLLIPRDRQKIIVQGKHPYLLERIMKRTTVGAALYLTGNINQNQSKQQMTEHPFVYL